MIASLLVGIGSGALLAALSRIPDGILARYSFEFAEASALETGDRSGLIQAAHDGMYNAMAIHVAAVAIIAILLLIAAFWVLRPARR
jgi:hypothetical protein